MKNSPFANSRLVRVRQKAVFVEVKTRKDKENDEKAQVTQ